ncbi:hypothetical protein NG895_09900 [Aeoliella sp. ICT_H6.2]|uniref:IRE (Iron responsive element) n=1 Tax=Aeoliella straminimaris TaxID=2954799 RepID=A0A9X2JIR5_9BACT|nr:hypothetical protein [Aeoliella straminimaris]MCO6044219.1 hypothetical protein [Aeoliella straminimaris]
MNKQSSFIRKVVYAGILICLLIALAVLGLPATYSNPRGGTYSLARMKVDNQLAQSNLGEIDPASETMKLATLGLRGVAVNLLWNKADEYKKKEDWTNLTATLEQLARLQPNFITFWKYQSWNVSYNVSVQFDDYRDRYYYVREGIEFLKQGVAKNKENREIPQLLWDLGWFIGQKIGRADEYVQYRELFKNDDEFHGDDVPAGADERDNWLVSKMEYLNAISAVRDRKKSIGKKSEKIFYSSPAKSQMSYAEAIEEEGQFAKGQAAWRVAADEWSDFGDLEIEHSTGRMLRLGHEEEVAERVEQLEDQLADLSPGLREKLVEEKREALPEEQQAALAKSMEERNAEEVQLAYQAEQAIEVNDKEFVDRLAKEKPELRKEAGILARQLVEERTNLIYTRRYKSDANYDYWALRAEFEQTDTAVEARRKMFEAKQAFADRQAPELAKQLYEEGFDKWREVLETYPDLLDPDGVTGDDILVFVVDYRKVLDSLGEEIPDDFVLWDVIENFDAEGEFEEELRHRMETMGTSTADEASASEEAAEEQPAEESAAEESSDEQPAEPEETPAEAEEQPSEPEQPAPEENPKAPSDEESADPETSA